LVRSKAGASKAAGRSWTILEGGRWPRGLLRSGQRAQTVELEATVRVGRSAWGGPVADAFLIVRSFELGCVVL
jgi:hypothetical protein